jgi:hypothetical protein
MPSEFPLRPRLQKGALAVYAKHGPGMPPTSVIVFQFNPDQMKRTLAHRATPPPPGGGGPAKEDVLRVGGPPVETITLSVDLHAADQLADPDTHAVVAEHGLHPALAALEMLMYPPTLDARSVEELARRGAVQVTSADLPLVLFVWGQSRVVPVKITSFSVSEEAFDTRLNPIAAKVDLGMQVLTYMEFPESSVGRDTFLSYQTHKESLARRLRPGDDARGVQMLLRPR